MGASLQEEQRQLRVILFPGHQPVGLNVALPLPLTVARQLMRAIHGGQSARFSEQGNCIENQLQVKTSLLAALQVLLEAFGSFDTIHCCCVVC